MITVTLMDRSGNGWGSGNSYEIRVRSSGAVVKTGTMNGAVGQDAYLTESFCLDKGVVYQAKLIREGSNSKDMSLDISQCAVHLSRYMDEAVVNLSDSGECNTCSGYSLDVMLLGPRVPIPYGWKDSTVYLLQNSTNHTVAEGTLVMGVMSRHTLCLQGDEYHLEFNNVPNHDDYYGVDASEGIDQYRIALLNCGVPLKNDDDLAQKIFPEPMIRPGIAFSITITSKTVCSYEYTSDKLDDDNEAFASQRLSLVAMLFAVVLAVWHIA